MHQHRLIVQNDYCTSYIVPRNFIIASIKFHFFRQISLGCVPDLFLGLFLEWEPFWALSQDDSHIDVIGHFTRTINFVVGEKFFSVKTINVVVGDSGLKCIFF